MYVYCNPNPCGRKVGDCVIRAVAIAENISWYEAYDILCNFGRMYCNWGNGNEAYGAFLRYMGYEQYGLPKRCPICYTVADFCKEHPYGTYIVGTGNHVVAIIDGNHIDAWDSCNEIIDRFFKKEEW